MTEYTIKDITAIVNRTPQRLYKLMRENKELSGIVAENSRETGENRAKVYGEPVLQWFISHYNIDYNSKPANESQPETDSESLYRKIGKLKRRIKKLKAENERLSEENHRLLTMLEKEQEQRQALLYGLFSQQHKQKLIEEPKRHWWNRKKGSADNG